MLKPSEKVPFSAILFADILYEAGLPREMLSVVTGDPREIADELITNPLVDLVTFTGGVAIGKYIASKAGYRRVVLELGGNDPIIVMEDADIDEASTLAVQGSYKNSGQRCTAIKRMLVHEAVAGEFVEQVLAKTRAWKYGDPGDKANDMEAGRALGIRDAGYYALDALRIEQGRRAWGAELGPDETPWEAGLAFSVKLDKPSAFIGKAALLNAQGLALRKKLVTLVLDTPEAYAWGGEAIVLDGQTVGEISSAGWSPLAGACVALGYVRGNSANHPHAGTPAQIELWGEQVGVKLYDRWPPTQS